MAVGRTIEGSDGGSKARSLAEPFETRSEEAHVNVEPLVNLGEAHSLVEPSEVREEAREVSPTWSHSAILERHAV